jgi:signal transduction histidine kinase
MDLAEIKQRLAELCAELDPLPTGPITAGAPARAEGAPTISGELSELTDELLRHAELLQAAVQPFITPTGAELRERADELDALLNVLPVGIGIAHDPACTAIRVNPAMAAMLDIPYRANASLTAPEEERPRNFRVYKDGIELSPEELPMQVAAREGIEIRNLEVDVVRDDGRRLSLLEYATPLYDEQGQVRGSIGAFVDITDRVRVRNELDAQRAAAQAAQKRAEHLAEQLREEAARLDQRVQERTTQLRLQSERLRLLHRIDCAILAANSPTEIAEVVAPHIRDIMSAERVSILEWLDEGQTCRILAADGSPSSVAVPGARLPVLQDRWYAGLSRGEVVTVEDMAALADADRSERALIDVGIRSFTGIPLLAGSGPLGAIMIGRSRPGPLAGELLDLGRQVADSLAVAVQNARLFDQVQTSRGELQSFSRRLVEIQEAERKAIARELHDETGQGLTSIKLALARLAREADCPPEMHERIEAVSRVTEQVMEDLHRLAAGLRPPSLDRYGLAPAVEQLVAAFRKQTGLEVELLVHGFGDERLPGSLETALYRIIQEALTNVLRHAHASRVAVALHHRGDAVVAMVEDNGVGFDPDEAARRGRLGLLGIRERAKMLGGSLTIESKPGQGTVMLVQAPVETRPILNTNAPSGALTGELYSPLSGGTFEPE